MKDYDVIVIGAGLGDISTTLASGIARPLYDLIHFVSCDSQIFAFCSLQLWNVYDHQQHLRIRV